jgi:ABC-type lipoprotein export system ATPase subunit
VRLVVAGAEVAFPGRPTPVLTGADLCLRSGETVAVLGPSGSGKSTLLSLLGGLQRPTAGRAYATDDDGSELPDPLETLTAWILQTTNALPERSALDNVAVSAQAAGRRRGEALRLARAALGQVGLADHADRPARLLSGGELQRVATARAVVSSRPFILADEPTGQLDHTTSDAVLDVLFGGVRSTVEEPAGIAVVTHDPQVAARCDRVVRIDDGQVVAA